MYRFGIFLFDAARLELTRDGRSVRLQRQPAHVLGALLERAGTLVSRDELRHTVWRDDTFVDFERGLNFCIAQIRTALGDQAAAPRYIRTVPKKGYEFICPVEMVGGPPEAGASANADAARPARFRTTRPRRWRIAASLGAVTIVLALAAYTARLERPPRPIVAVARFDNQTGDPDLTRFADYLTDTVTEQLTSHGAGRFDVIGNAAILREPRDRRDLDAIASTLHASYIVIGQVQRDTTRVRVLGHLIRLPDQTHVMVSRFDDVVDRSLAGISGIAARMAEKLGPAVSQAASRAAATR